MSANPDLFREYRDVGKYLGFTALAILPVAIVGFVVSAGVGLRETPKFLLERNPNPYVNSVENRAKKVAIILPVLAAATAYLSTGSTSLALAAGVGTVLLEVTSLGLKTMLS